MTELQVWVGRGGDRPNWASVPLFNFHQEDSRTVFYGEHSCGECNMRAMEEEQEQELEMQDDDYDTEEEDWSVSELPSQMPSLATFFRFVII